MMLRFHRLIKIQKRNLVLMLTVGTVAAACAPKPELPPLQPAADMCALYRSYAYSAAAAAVESIDSLRSHVANEAAFSQKCLLDPNRKGGPR